MIGKYILPWFGSSPGVWTTALLFFQFMLLAGYAYAHLIASKLSIRTQAIVHLVLLGVVVLLLPITPSESWKPEVESDPIWRILLLLTVSVGGPYLLLASSSPLLQDWFARLYEGESPYRLYAISNAGSLLALLSYPFLFERYFRLQTQTWGWSIGFVLFVLLGGYCASRLLKQGKEAKKRGSKKAAVEKLKHMGSPGLSRILLWLALSACGSTVLLATTNLMSQNVTPVPFLFILPLSLYLLTFIITFDSPRWYYRPVFCVLLPIGIACACITIFVNVGLGLIVHILLYAVALFACCMSCHGELVRLKPHPRHLTLFYMMVSLGGALGGFFVAIIAPNFFNGFWEYEISLLAAYGLVMGLVGRDLLRQARVASAAPVETQVKADTNNPRKKSKKPSHKPKKARRKPRQLSPEKLRQLGMATLLAGFVGLVVLLGGLGWNLYVGNKDMLAQVRNFYGGLQIYESLVPYPRIHKNVMYHGQIRHGAQYQLPERRSWPTTYYSPNSGVGLAIEHHPKRKVADHQFRMGVIGLGVGTVSAYANDPVNRQRYQQQEDDYVLYYEINPQVVDLANEHFTYTQDARERGAEIELAMGDARIVMERQLEEGKPQQFDVLIIDAFSGDAVPMHLLTKECFETYLGHLNPDGVLALHISSRYINLRPVIRKLAELNGTQGYFIRHDGNELGASSSSWVLVTNNQAFLQTPAVEQVITPLNVMRETPVLWTDDYGSLFDVLD